MARRPPAPTAAVRALVADGAPHALRPYAHDPRAAAGEGSGLEAATALGVEPHRVLKTLVALVDEQPLLAVVPVTGRLDLRALAAARGGRRAVLAEPAAAERLTGGVVGAISPLGLRRPLPVVVDASAAAHDAVLVSAGRRGLDVELAPADLLRLCGGAYAEVARPSSR
nr:aminoacyl-tRNA deacylase [uncultured Pseudokineococcus sp.]